MQKPIKLKYIQSETERADRKRVLSPYQFSQIPKILMHERNKIPKLVSFAKPPHNCLQIIWCGLKRMAQIHHLCKAGIMLKIIVPMLLRKAQKGSNLDQTVSVYQKTVQISVNSANETFLRDMENHEYVLY